ncbi:MAG TPA: PKD domain-containing protein [Thermoanaerobaculia bacterium]|nr:PKD domain-containing protein [Thermoanaerobaculia bacterium]
MKRIAMGLTFALGLFAFMGTARAADDACFTWDCNDSTHVCSFDASCSTIVHNLYRYYWDFGDGSTQDTGVATITHSYSTPYPSVTLTLWFLNANPVSTSSCGIVVWNNVGPAQPTYGSCN